jgi:hypothetical protein
LGGKTTHPRVREGISTAVHAVVCGASEKALRHCRTSVRETGKWLAVMVLARYRFERVDMFVRQCDIIVFF